MVKVQRLRRQNYFEINLKNFNTITNVEYILKSDGTITDKEGFQNNYNS